MEKPPDLLNSSALKANMATTAARVEIPKKFAPLLQAVEDFYGVHKRIQELLTELNHPFVNWEFVTDSLKAFSVNDFSKFNAHAQATEAIDCVLDIYFQIIDNASESRIVDKTLRFLFDFFDTVFSESGTHLERNLALVDAACGRLLNLAAHPELKLKRCSAHSKFLVRSHNAVLERLTNFAALTEVTFAQTYQHWLKQIDPVTWFDRNSLAGLTASEEYDPEAPARIRRLKEMLEPLSHNNLRQLLDKMNLAAGRQAPDFSNMLTIPDYQQILAAYIKIADQIEHENAFGNQRYLTKLDYLFNIVGSAALEELHTQSLQEINRSLSLGFAEEPENRRASFIMKICGTLNDFAGQQRFRSIFLSCILTMARDVVKTDNRQMLEILIDAIIQSGFQYPEVAGSNSEWQIQVNPDHIRNIRVWMEIIAMKPAWTRRLLSALIINLKLGGVLIRDTDLFQRDISAYLNAGIGHNLNLSKQLLRLFPAFFNEIGAEGELREISTRADELCSRRDILVHFIRKQSHVESNNNLVNFLAASFQFWATANHELIRPYVPVDVLEQIDTTGEYFTGLHQAFAKLAGEDLLDTARLLEVKTESLKASLDSLPITNRDRNRARYLIRMFQLLTKKYNPQPLDLLNDLAMVNLFEPSRIKALEKHLSHRDFREALFIVLDFRQLLQEIILSPEKTAASENIYFKRHIAAGIPSMYGVYHEPKFDALGLSLRLESFGTSLFEMMVEEMGLTFITKSTIMKIHTCLPLFLKALEIEGIPHRQIASRIEYLKSGLGIKLFSIDQYLDIFLGISKAIQNIIHDFYIDTHRNNLPIIIRQMLQRGCPGVKGTDADENTCVLRVSENFLRSLLSSAFSLQVLDKLINRIVITLREELEKFRDKKAILNLVTTYNPDITVSNIHEADTGIDNAILLGNKGYWLKRLAAYGFPVPQGFILTTEVFRCFDALIGYKHMLKDLTHRIHQAVERIEEVTGKKFGSPENPLLFSVRSGAAISMPGMMNTFLNVGINKSVCESLSTRKGYEWAAWDSYRRFLQMWGMNEGLDRNYFDGLIEDFKKKFGVSKKLQFSPAQMREIAISYRENLQKKGIKVFDNPLDQLKYAILRAFQSWNSDCARLFRRQMNISDDWGTAVVVQTMVFGNLGTSSGSGVTFTRDPNGQNTEIHLFGDFFFGVQGDDIVSGLIETYPISEYQRLKERPSATMSLETQFPEIYNRLLQHATTLIVENGFPHQEIEFTFENETAGGLHILQTRDQYQEKETRASTFFDSDELHASLLGNGVGVGGGAISGKVVFSEREIRKSKKYDPDTPLILIRPDTVPEDVGLLLQVEGLLTARGGRTSHAAVTIPQLKKVGVVGFNKLKVYETDSYCIIAGRLVKSGEYLSIDGWTGAVYFGQHRHD
jgi:pyruvate,orthophosphate dikinase